MTKRYGISRTVLRNAYVSHDGGGEDAARRFDRWFDERDRSLRSEAIKHAVATTIKPDGSLSARALREIARRIAREP